MNHFKKFFPAALGPLIHVATLSLILLSGCQSERGAPQQTARNQPTPPPALEANILFDEPLLAKPYAIIGGTVQNTGNGRLEKLSVEIELKRRSDLTFEKREVSVVPGDLEPGQEGKFSLKVLSEEWSGSRVVSLKSGSRAQDVAFKSLPGAKRPPEKIKDNVRIVNTPTKKKSDGSEFINTPDTPYKVP